MNLVLHRLDEQERRWVAGLESKKIGYGGDTAVAHHRIARRYYLPRPRRTGCRPGRSTHRPRAPARRRTPAREKKDPTIVEDLKELAEPVTGGDPMSEAQYIRRSLQHLSEELAELGHAACPTTVAALLEELGYRLRVNVKRLTGPYHPDRDTQFRYLGALVESFREEGWPILSVDAKKKELVGNFDNPGATWLQTPYEVNAHDFLTDAKYRAAPYGLYDVLANQGHVVVGTSADTPQFAAEAVAHWWARIGCHRYRQAVLCCSWPTVAAATATDRGCGKRACKNCWPIAMAWW